MNFKAGFKLRMLLLTLGAAALASSCTKHLIFDYEGNCDDSVEVYLKYDYNIERADMRADHTGYAIVYAVGEDGRIAAQTTVSGLEIHDKNSVVKFDGLQPGRYTFTALAMQNPYSECASGSGSRFRVNFPENGSAISDLKVRLDRSLTPDAEGLYAVDAPSQGLDTLWVGQSIKAGGLVVPEKSEQRGNILRDTVSLVRDTKYLNITLHQIEDPAEIHDKDFIVNVMDANGSLAWDNSLIPDEKLLYSPHACWTTAMSKNGVAYMSEAEAEKAPADDPVVQRAAHFEISFSRLMYYAMATEGTNAVLCIKAKDTNETVVEINLPYFLSFARDAYSVYHYSSQEYLDREYHYNLDFFLGNGGWKYVNIRLNTMPWAKRIYNQIL